MDKLQTGLSINPINAFVIDKEDVEKIVDDSNFDLSVGLTWLRTNKTDNDNIVGGDVLDAPRRINLHSLIGVNPVK